MPRKDTIEEVKNKFHNKWGYDLYDYSLFTDYKGSKEKIPIICKRCGKTFWMKPNHHLLGFGHKECNAKEVGKQQSRGYEGFVKEARCKFGGKFKYLPSEYKNKYSIMNIECPKHGLVKQRAYTHLDSMYGCKYCAKETLTRKNHSSAEREIKQLLIDNQIKFIDEYNTTWLGLQSLDFYLPEYNIGIECQGLQHFEARDYFGGDKGFVDTQRRDQSKLKKCQENGVKLLYYSNLSIPFPYKVYTDKDNLLEEIKNG